MLPLASWSWAVAHEDGADGSEEIASEDPPAEICGCWAAGVEVLVFLLTVLVARSAIFGARTVKLPKSLRTCDPRLASLSHLGALCAFVASTTIGCDGCCCWSTANVSCCVFLFLNDTAVRTSQPFRAGAHNTFQRRGTKLRCGLYFYSWGRGYLFL